MTDPADSPLSRSSSDRIEGKLPPHIEIEAADWFGRREVGLTSAEQAEFERWLAADQRHAEQLQLLDETWKLLDDLPETVGKSSDKHDIRTPIGAITPAPTTAVVTRFPTHGRPPSQHRRRALVANSLILAAAAAIAFIFLPRFLTSEPEPIRLEFSTATHPEGPRNVSLPDGSRIQLNAQTSVTVELGARERRVRLTEGEAYFIVAKDAQRPFTVSAGVVSVRAVGTAFNVRRASASVAVIVTEGKVALDHSDVRDTAHARSNFFSRLTSFPSSTGNATSSHQPLGFLSAGEGAEVSFTETHSKTSSITALPATDLTPALSWQIKMLEFDMTPLSRVIADFNRYNSHQLIISDVELARKPFGGSFRADNYESLVELLESRFNVIADRASDRTVLRLRRD
ncbi:MAG TPA: FecR domain-containing protein [Opitutaceae bacterium]|nr:FecR domain-containing protein [Opitutaceae bacterium]